MDTPSTSPIVEAEVIRGALLITFEDGTAGLYSAEVLRKYLPEAVKIPDSVSEPEPAYVPPATEDFLP